jgi:hypothetical protein
LCLSQARTWLSNVISHGLFYVQGFEGEVIVIFVDIGGIVETSKVNIDRKCISRDTG